MVKEDPNKRLSAEGCYEFIDREFGIPGINK